jgi:hypothetical protein
MKNKISLIGIANVVLYFLSVVLYLILKTETALTLWELMTVLSGPLMLIILLELGKIISVPEKNQKAMTVFMGCTCALTAAAHIVNISVTRNLIKNGIDVPPYFQIGFWPSVEMAIDYLAWGFFMGLAFLCVSLPIKDAEKSKQRIKIVTLINSILCLGGFTGALFINENLWYLAPMGYGIGWIVMCVLMGKAENNVGEK